MTNRTLRHWHDLGLVRPSGYRPGKVRVYTSVDIERVTLIKDLQELLGFSLAEVRTVLDKTDTHALDVMESKLLRTGVNNRCQPNYSTWRYR